MDRNSLRTSVVIEVANQEEPEDQKTYQIDFDDLDIPKDYVIDQVFCGENITVYALFEVPEEDSTTTNEQKLEVSNSKQQEGYRFFHRNSSKKIMNHRKINGFRQNIMDSEESSVNLLSNKENGNGSFYCLKHLSGDYDMLTPERENSELKVLYSKSTVSKHSRSTKFKAVSKGVNTDIVQSPKIIQEVEKAVKQNIPFSKTERKAAGVRSLSTSKPSYEVIEMEMRQSFSSLSSYGDNGKTCKKSIPNFFLVPLLMMEDGVLSHFQNDDKIQKLVEDKEVKVVVPEMISMGTNTESLVLTPSTTEDYKTENTTDVSHSESLKSESDNDVKRNEISKQMNSDSHLKLNNKTAILSEIKKLQGKLNALIKSIESDSFEVDTSEGDVVEPDCIMEEPPTEKSETSEILLPKTVLKPFRPNWKTYDDLPILSTLSYPVCKNSTPTKKKLPESSTEEVSEDDALAPTKSVSIGFISGGGSSNSQIIRCPSTPNSQPEKSKEELKKVASNSSIIWSQLENRKGNGLSKSTTHLSAIDPKLCLINGLRKSLSFDLRDVKLEVTCLKKIKNNSFKHNQTLETKPNIRIPPKGEAILKCEMGDEAFNKPKPSKIDVMSLTKAIEKVDSTLLEKGSLESKKNLKEEEGDAKLVYSKQNLLSQIINRKAENVEVHFCNTISALPQENLIATEKSLPPNPVKSKATCNSGDTEVKVCNDVVEKPTTPNKSFRKSAPPSGSVKKEIKPVKKINNRTETNTNKIKQGEKYTKPEAKDTNQSETVKQRSVTGSRKFTLKGTAESKLHVDRLMRSENSMTSKAAEKTEKLDKPEKSGIRASRLPCQKREPPESAPVISEDSKTEDKTEKTKKSESLVVLNKKDLKEDTETIMGLEKIGKDIFESAEATSDNSPSPALNQSGVVVELFSEKPKSSDLLCCNENKNSANQLNPYLFNDENTKVQENGVPQEKPVVKSVWALTKVLLFEDGSKKIEILEASLTPPGYSLPKNPPE